MFEKKRLKYSVANDLHFLLFTYGSDYFDPAGRTHMRKLRPYYIGCLVDFNKTGLSALSVIIHQGR